jgi:hypothetical protein
LTFGSSCAIALKANRPERHKTAGSKRRCRNFMLNSNEKGVSSGPLKDPVMPVLCSEQLSAVKV